MAARQRRCPLCGYTAETGSFLLVRVPGVTPQHNDLRRRCANCSAERAAWAFAIVTKAEREPPDAA